MPTPNPEPGGGEEIRAHRRKRRVWKPIDLAPGLRLYSVESFWPIAHGRKCEYRLLQVVAAESPSRAAELISETYADTREEDRPLISGHPLNVYLPEDWRERTWPNE